MEARLRRLASADDRGSQPDRRAAWRGRRPADGRGHPAGMRPSGRCLAWDSPRRGGSVASRRSKMGRIFGFVLCLGIALSGAPALAEEAGGASAEKALEERIRELEEKRAKLVEERDAARMRANVYVLPQDKLRSEERRVGKEWRAGWAQDR